MRNESAAPDPPLDLPLDLQSDYLEFRARLAGHRGLVAPLREAVSQLARFGCLVHEHSGRLALVARGDRPVLFTRHVLDSLNLLGLLSPPPGSVLDVGAGAGFPGIPLAIVWRETRVTLLESQEKKCGFLELAVRKLGLQNARVVCARLESLGKGWEAKRHACVVTRAVGDLPGLLAAAGPAALPGALWVYYLGAETKVERLLEQMGRAAAGAIVRRGAFGGRILMGEFPAP